MYVFEPVVDADPVEATIPMTSKVFPPIETVSPTAFDSLSAYAASSTTTSLPASAVVKGRPFVVSVLVSGPTVSPETGMPVTVNESTLNEPPPKPPPPWPVLLWPVLPWPVPLGGPLCAAPSLLLLLLLLPSLCSTWPENVLFSSVRTPVAAATPSVPATVATFAAVRVLVPRDTARRDWARSVEPLLLPDEPWSPKSNDGRPVLLDVGVSVFVTVMSVPTPYTDARTLDWADCTPLAIDETMTTSAMANAIPTAMMTVCFLRFVSSRLR